MSSRSPSASALPESESEASWTPGHTSDSSSYETVTEGGEIDERLLHETEEEVDDDEDDDDDDEDDDDEDESTAFIDANDILDALIEDADDTEQEGNATESQENSAQPDTSNTAQPGPMTISRHELLQLLSQTDAFRRIFRTSRTVHTGVNIDDDDDDQDDSYHSGRQRRRRSKRTGATYPKIPSEVGKELMESGVFGTNERDQGNYERKKKLAARIMRRELGLGSPGKEKSSNRLVSQALIPSSNADTIIHYDNRCYSGQFSDDGNFFFSCCQDFRVRMYDTSNPYNWRYYKTVVYPYGQWTITDATLSPDNRFLAYSSIRSTVCLAHTDPDQQSEPYNLDFANMGRRGAHFSYSPFGIWSIRFSGDGREIVAGTSDHSVYVYDLDTRQTVLRIPGHDDEVNAVCFGDKSSPHLLYSGSDDTTLKVWDRRSLGDSREAGVFLGHTEGLTYVDSKGDGRYVLSNAKDQTMKLWDLRKMVATEKAHSLDLSRYTTGFDYRFQPYNEEDYEPHPYDCSLVTFRGHSVLKTLIRCHFSPPGSTDSRYVYSGSENGTIYVYNLDATIAAKINVQQATQNTRPRGSEDPDMISMSYRREGGRWETCVRDVSWHPNAPVIAATSWNGYGMSNGTCTVHTWNDGVDDDEAEPRMGQRVGPQLQRDARLYQDPSPVTAGRRSYRATRLRRPLDDDE